MKPIDRLLFAQGGSCFFCNCPLYSADASVEHLVASANGGTDNSDNCVACCKALNSLLGCMSLKEKLRVVLNQKGKFKCPNGHKPDAPAKTTSPKANKGNLDAVVADLQKRGSNRPRTLNKLRNALTARFRDRFDDKELGGLIKALQDEGILSINGPNVSYQFPP